jgi:hypothetical protein
LGYIDAAIREGKGSVEYCDNVSHKIHRVARVLPPIRKGSGGGTQAEVHRRRSAATLWIYAAWTLLMGRNLTQAAHAGRPREYVILS